ncbi:hypothetical protein OROGR_028506 [Orobanche gracilis]
MDECQARVARSMRKNKLKRKRESSLGTNETTNVDGYITNILPSSSSIPVAIDTSKLHVAPIKRFESDDSSKVIADFTSGRTNSVILGSW